ncbi:unnamed protein product [Scomber scombrus]
MFSSYKDKRKICGGRSAVKRSYTEITQDSRRTAELSSPQRKKIKICRRRLAMKRPFSEVSQDDHRDQEMSSPERKRRRITTNTEEKVIVLPNTSKETPCTVAKVSSKGTRPCTVTSRVSNIWIIGDSYIRRGEEAAKKEYGKNLGLNANIQWFGKGGMRWGGVLPSFYAELANQSPPDILVVHAGGNDLGLMSPKKLAFLMQRDLQQLRAQFPSMQMAFSCISERQQWRHGKPVQINNDRKSVNKFMRKNVDYIGGELIEHLYLKFYNKNTFLPDGVHLTTAGNQVFLTSIQSTLEKILQRSSSEQRV